MIHSAGERAATDTLPVAIRSENRAQRSVVFLTDAVQWGGSEVQTGSLVARLLEDNVNATIVELNSSDIYRANMGEHLHDHIQQLSVSGHRSLSVRQWGKLFRKLDKKSVCVLVKGGFKTGSWQLDCAASRYFHRYVTIEHSLAGAMPRRTSRRYLVGLIPGLGFWWYKERFDRWLRGWWPESILAVAEAVRKRLVEQCHFRSSKVFTVANGIDVSRFQFNDAARTRVRNEWKISDDTMIIGYVGRLSTEKRLDRAIHAFAKLRDSQPKCNLQLVLVGEGPELATLRRLAVQKNVRDYVLFAGFIADIAPVYSAFDAFILTSEYEGMPLSLLEAMACERWSIAMRVGGISEVLQDPHIGIAVDDDIGLVQSFRDFANATSDAKCMLGRLARRKILEAYDQKTQIEEIMQYILGVPDLFRLGEKEVDECR